MFNFAIWVLQRWLKKKGIENDAVIIISKSNYSFDDYENQKNILEG